MTHRFITHARNMEELRSEFISDINRRLNIVMLRIKNAPSARRSASLVLLREELESQKEFWEDIEFAALRKKGAPVP
jgi:hypothetical protein